MADETIKIIIYKNNGGTLALDSVDPESLEVTQSELRFVNKLKDPLQQHHPNLKGMAVRKEFVFNKSQILGYAKVTEVVKDEEPIE